MPDLSFDGSYFILRCTYGEREIPKANGFRWSAESKVWYTPDLAVAARLREYAAGEAKVKLSQILLRETPWTLPLPLLPEGLKLLPHQHLAIRYALSRNKSYLGLDPGLGKTICAAVIASAIKKPVVYVTPPFLVENVKAEFEKWAPGTTLAIVRDSMLQHFEWEETGKEAVLFVDESHRFKSPEAKRTQALFGHKPKAAAPKPGLASHFAKQIYMSGTPMPNRPMELYPLLSTVAPETIDFMGSFDYGRKFCAGHKTDFGWDFSGASNMDELQRRVIGPFMLRQKKELLDLPPKLEEAFVVSGDMSPALKDFDKMVGIKYKNTEDLIKQKLASIDGGDLHLATYRRLLGAEKARLIIPYIESLIDETEESILVYAYHKEAIETLRSALVRHKPYVINGETPVAKRHEIVADFMSSPDRRIIIGNYVAMGVGFTLTKATRCLFVEFDWVPGVNAQASDRIHRIGQKSSVLVQYVVYKNSVDYAVLQALMKKQRAIDYV